jgi:hypothetical protein
MRKVVGLAPARAEDGICEVARGEAREFLGELGPGQAGEVMIADVKLARRCHHRLDDLRIAVTEVEGAAVEMEADQLVPVEVPDPVPLPAPHHELRAERVPAPTRSSRAGSGSRKSSAASGRG